MFVNRARVLGVLHHTRSTRGWWAVEVCGGGTTRGIRTGTVRSQGTTQTVKLHTSPSTPPPSLSLTTPRPLFERGEEGQARRFCRPGRTKGGRGTQELGGGDRDPPPSANRGGKPRTPPYLSASPPPPLCPPLHVPLYLFPYLFPSNPPPPP